MARTLKVSVVRVTQLLTIVLFSFFTMTYFGAFLLLPLSLIYWLGLLLGFLLPSLLAGMVALGLVGYLGLQVYRMPEIYKTIACGGMQLIDLGYAQVQRLGDLLLEEEAVA